MEAVYYGHSTVGLNLNNIEVLFDPFITHNKLAAHVDLGALKPDYIFLSHCHGDHVADLVEVQRNGNSQVVSIVESAAWVKKQGIATDKVTGMNFGGTISTDFGSAKMVYALHTNSTPEGGYAGVAAGYVLKSGDKTIYFAGDTALTLEMQLLADQNLDWAFLPIGGFFTMDVEDAIKAAGLINCKNIIGIHYNTFPPIEINTEEAIEKFRKAGFNLHLLKVGEKISL
ncbi:metal-dependent hydrolase [Albibacterium sp.]|uniref:metal-dependent hydrolase n=1 Tax=Albibacterium sp. TaxID=2952885 RepID=UPI002BA7FF1E|nr:metal-dependent hydrolase [Albibacterium sp.]HUH19848.1 metal-dependent hydrolase [Albibacterium sp.]